MKNTTTTLFICGLILIIIFGYLSTVLINSDDFILSIMTLSCGIILVIACIVDWGDKIVSWFRRWKKHNYHL